MTNFRAWCNDNLFLVAAICLPLLIVTLFSAATVVPRWLVPAPQFDPVFAVSQYNQAEEPFGVTFHAAGQAIVATVAYHHDGRTMPRSRLFRFDVSEDATHEVPFTVPEAVKARLRVQETEHDFVSEELVLRDALDSPLIDQRIAPDGYRSRNEYAGSGVFGEVFGMGGRREVFAIEKGGRIIDIRLPGEVPYRYDRVQLIGWTAPAGRSQ